MQDDNPTNGEPARLLLVCTGPCCNVRGEAMALLRVLKDYLPYAGSDEPAYLRRSCLGRCTGTPVVCVKPDDVYYLAGNRRNLLRIVREHLYLGLPVEELQLPPPASGQGKVA